MGLNKSIGNMYEFITHTWNVIKGECPHGCTYCYMKRFGKQKPLRFDEKELKTDLGMGNFIFVGSSCDIFAESIPQLWLNKTIMHCKNYPNNKYFFQTKNPKRILDNLEFIPGHSVICTTIETNRYYDGIMGNTPYPVNRANIMEKINILFETYVTIEPIIDFDLIEIIKLIKWCNPKQINIGADTGRNNLPEPSKDKILQLIEALSEFTIVHQKSNLKRLLK